MKQSIKRLLWLPSGSSFAHRTSRYAVKPFVSSALFLLVILVVGILKTPVDTLPVHAQDTDFSNGITVDSTLDTPDSNVGDGICNDGSGNCTLRAAIQEANSNPDASTILFNITGTPSFTNNSQPGYTISPTSALPNITEQLTIDGYSQPGAQANTAVAPEPLNGTLLIELDGSNTTSANGFSVAGDGTEIRGLVINRFDGQGLSIEADNISAQGNYIGTDPTGLIDRGNDGGGIMQGADDSENLQVGGLSPEDRNIISGNENGGSAPNTGSNHWTYQGNYIGLGADGLTSIPNNQIGGSGALSLDNSDDHVVGGTQTGAINVIGANLGHGIAPHNSDNLLIEGNYIGLGYDGTTILGSGSTGFGSGIALSSSNNVTIKNNRVAGWATGGININGSNSNVMVEGNTVHDNQGNGIRLGGSNDIQIVSNSVYNNTGINVSIIGFSAFGIPTDNVSVVSNNIGLDATGTPTTNNNMGIAIQGNPANVIIGGTSPSDANRIVANKGSGISVLEFEVPAMSVSIQPQKVSILGNSIYDTSPASDPSTGAGLGIDLMVGIETDSIPDGIPNTYTSSGPTPNDPTDSDTGPNNYINFPVLNSVTQDGSNATINFNLDAADSPTDQYRIEFFSNDTPDPSGYGEGQTYLGSTTVSNGNNQQTSFTLPNNINLAGKSISATTTAIDSTTNSGFGSTSEFSQIRLASVVTTPGTSQKEGLAGTGENVRMILIFAITLLTVGVVAVAGFRKKAGSSR